MLRPTSFRSVQCTSSAWDEGDVETDIFELDDILLSQHDAEAKIFEFVDVLVQKMEVTLRSRSLSTMTILPAERNFVIFQIGGSVFQQARLLALNT